jgi:hypothetical protein
VEDPLYAGRGFGQVLTNSLSSLRDTVALVGQVQHIRALIFVFPLRVPNSFLLHSPS